MSRRRRSGNERPLTGIVLAACGMLLAGFVVSWLYLQHVRNEQGASSFTTLKRVAVGRDGYSIAATIAIKTSDADLRWAGRNRINLETEFQRALYELDPQRARAPGGLQAFQQGLAATLNQALNTDKIQQVVLTDFLVAEGDY